MPRFPFALLLCGFAFVTGLRLAAVESLASLRTDANYNRHFDQGLRLLQLGDTGKAKVEFEKCLVLQPSSPEVHYQLARLYLVRFYQAHDLSAASRSVDGAAKEIDQALKLNAGYINALRMKFDLHRTPMLLHYDATLAYEIGGRIIALDPFCYDFQVDMAQWMSSELRFTVKGGDQSPQDSEISLKRAIGLLDLMLKSMVPHTEQEQRALSLMGRALAKSGQYTESLAYFQSRLVRPLTDAERTETLRDLGSSYYRLGSFSDAANLFTSAYELQPSLRDLWLLKICIDRVGYSSDKLPSRLLFPLRDEKWDQSHPPLTKFSRVDVPAGLDRTQGHGATAWGDFDRDGRDDLLIAGSDTFLTLLKNEGNSFRDVTEKTGLLKIPSGNSLNFVDYDNDGWLDIYVCLNGWSGPLPNRLLRNRGNGTFQDVSKQAGVDDPGSGFVSLWGDLDNDGDLDLVVANGVLKDGSTTQIYQNNGNGTFTNVTRRVGIIEPPEYGTIGIALGDYDRDGDLDLLINGWEPAPNRLYRNNGNFTFTEVAQQAGVVQPPHRGSVCVFLDYDNDTYPDILTCSLSDWEATLEGLTKGYTVKGPQALNPGAPRLFQNTRQGTFKDVTAEAGLIHPIGALTVAVSDLDNDGFVDLYFGTSGLEWGRLEPNRFYRNNGNGTFSDLTRYSGLDNVNKTSGISLSDFDGDGDLDIYIQSGGLFRGEWNRSLFYRNEAGSLNHWLQVQLTGVKSNRFGIGTQLIAKCGALTVHRQFMGNEASGSSALKRVSIGLGGNEHLDSLEVVWPSGERQFLKSILADRVIRVIEPADGGETQ